MIKRLQRKFIAITMCSILVVLVGLIGSINVANYLHVNQTADERLGVLAENGGVFPRDDRNPGDKKKPPRDLSPEAPFDTRYFTVSLRREDGTVLAVNTGRIAAVSTEIAAEQASRLFEQGKTGGFWKEYKFCAVEQTDTVMYIFLDCSRELSTFTSFLLASVSASVVGMLLVLLLVIIFSRRAVKPVAESYDKQKQFITDASHEIKTPLTVIDASVEVLEMENGVSEWTGHIRQQVARLTALTEKLVYLARMDEEGRTWPMTDFSLSDAVEETVQPFRAVAAAQGKTLQGEIEAQVSYCGDEASLRQLMSLLLDNAVKYTNPGGTIVLRLRACGKSREITLWNTVEQIPAGNLDRLFERFYRLDSSRNSATGGQGIGLSIAQAIVTAHKGTITAQSDDGRSILFTVVL